MKPKTDKAVPATAPIGSIDRAFMLELDQPNMNMQAAVIRKNARIGTAPTTTYTSQTALNAVKTGIAK
ncbi:hypothetical protein [Microvirga sp. BSC39]|jgi:hypothetical protein|uniref:hypothetical protein n=1 Tax=Microvirga sp. BSC39 TaxID=1549810 RepID=UPI0004E8C0C0|nr:hypothetical protein [Microvirga sp. BSC39]KFG70556.1 hypothetical protein JH26_03420 [Microvirga sp. BSC39]